MKRILSGLSVQIWLPFATSLAFGFFFIAYYYPLRQGELFRESVEKNLDELSTVLALSVDLSLDQQYFEGLSKSINAAKESQYFEFAALVQLDTLTGKQVIIASNPSDLSSAFILTPDSTRFIFKKQPLRTNDLQGYVIIAASRDKLEKKVIDLNNPVYITLGTVLLLSLLVFGGIARFLSRPIALLTIAANELKRGNYSLSIEQPSGATEIIDLSNALEELRNALLESRKRNEDFNMQLESEIKERTKDLESAHRLLLEAQKVAKLGYFEINLDTGHWHASETIYSILGKQHNIAHTDRSWKFLFSPENVILLDRLFKNSVKNGNPFQQDLCFRSDNISLDEQWVSISGEVVGEESSNSFVVRGTIQDITQRKRIENEVRRLSLVAEKTSNCVIITDINRKIVWVNESTLLLTEFTRDEIIGRSPSMFQFEKTSETTKSYIRNRLDQLQEVNVQLINRSKSGREYWLEINIVPLFDEENVHIGFMAVEIDITERVKFAEEIKESEANFRSILENSSEMIHSADAEGKLIWANRSWKEKLGVRNIDIKGLELSQFLSEDTIKEYNRVFPLLRKGESIKDLDCLFVSNENSVLNLIGTAIPIFKNGEFIGSQAYLQDITKIRKAESSLRQLLELTQQQNERLRNFTHIVSHNLRSHSSNLSGLISLMQSDWPEFIHDIYFTNLRAAVNNLSEVIFNLSEVALIQTGDGREFSSCNLNGIVESAITNVFGLAQMAGVEVRFLTSDEKFVKGDRTYLDSIVLNLLTNSIKYKAEDRRAFVEISISESNDFVQLDVRDNGLGIDLERQGRKIFGMYKTFHRHPEARGLGLFLVKNQVEAMGGRIQVESVVNQGSLFSVFLPSFKI